MSASSSPPDPAHPSRSDLPTAAAGSAGLGVHVLGIDHVGVAVADVDEAVARYRRLLGLVELHREVNDEQGVVEVMLGSPRRPSAPPLQVLAPTGPASPLQRFLHRRGPGLQQLAYRVDDVAQASRTLADAGVRLLYDEPRTGTAGSRINFIHPADGGGVLIELVELVEPADPSHLPARGRS